MSREVLSGASRVLRAQVPYRLLKNFHRVQQRLVRELEKKFSGKDVTLVANRRIMPKQGGGQSNARPRSRTLTAVRPLPGRPAALAARCVLGGGSGGWHHAQGAGGHA